MKPIAWQAQLGSIALGYAPVTVVAAGLLYERHLQELNHPADVAASGGMYAGGDALLSIFIICFFMIPTVFLVWVVAKFEALFLAYSQLLLVLCLYRLLWSPFMLVVIGVSRCAARIDRAKKLTFYALLIEGLTLVIAVALLVHG